VIFSFTLSLFTFCLLAPFHCCLSHVGISTILNTTTTSSDTDVETSTTFRSATRRLRHTPATSRPKYERLCMILIDCRLVGLFFGDSFCTILCSADCVTDLGSLHMGKVDRVHCLKCVYVIYVYIYLFIVYIYVKSWLHPSFHRFVCYCRAKLCFTPF